MIRKLLVFFLLLNVYKCEANLSEHFDDLIKHGEQLYTKVYVETPTTDQFVNSDIQFSTPSKLLNYTSHVAGLFDDWNEKQFVDNALNALLFGNMSEAAKNSHIETTTSLRKFLGIRDQYSYETYAEFGVPTTLR
jgi:hypothetical protein